MPRRQCTKFIPDSDSDFARMARNFACAIARRPERYFVSHEESVALTAAVTAFRDALAPTRGPTGRNRASILRKHSRRAEAEAIIRRLANRIRANDAIDDAARVSAGMTVRSKRLNKRTCPRTAPILHFVGEGSRRTFGYKTHRLRFLEERGGDQLARLKGLRRKDRVRGRAKPEGAARLELFIEFVAQGEPVPRSPGELSGGRPWYLRSYTTNPMTVLFPIPTSPMLVCYWARWADARGNVGSYSDTLVTQIEGWMPGMALPEKTHSVDPKRIMEARARNVKILSQQMEIGELNSLPDPSMPARLPDAA